MLASIPASMMNHKSADLMLWNGSAPTLS